MAGSGDDRAGHIVGAYHGAGQRTRLRAAPVQVAVERRAQPDEPQSRVIRHGAGDFRYEAASPRRRAATYVSALAEPVHLRGVPAVAAAVVLSG
ncbi:hypothetical protein [Pseudonocardia bannensis]|uniref:hypothetical protein n=1 Tax=Pseudonocardia bannensis TaxID=630973 RepID=UPI001B7D0BDE|nr:hypothetical protein [Pseudonocardia bannensis]